MKQGIELYQDALARLTTLRYQLDGIVDGASNPEMHEAAFFLDQIEKELNARLTTVQEQVDEFCLRCGVNVQATHAPWCQYKDGTPVPDEYVQTIYALERAKTFIRDIAKNAVGDDHFLWALSELMKHLAEWVYPLRQPF